MGNKRVLWVLAVLSLGVALALTGCSNPAGDGDDKEDVTKTYSYTGSDNVVYKLEITGSRAVTFTPAEGDSYKLYAGDTLISSGKLAAGTTATNLVLQPKAPGASTVTVTVTEDGTIPGGIPEITKDDGTKVTPPAPKPSVDASVYVGEYYGKNNETGGITFTLTATRLSWTGDSEGGWDITFSAGGDLTFSNTKAGTWDYIIFNTQDDSKGKKAGYIIKQTDGQVTLLTGANATAEQMVNGLKTLFGITIDMTGMPNDTDAISATTIKPTTVADSKVNGLTYTGSPVDVTGGKHYKLSVDFATALSALNTLYRTSMTVDNGTMNKEGSSLTEDNNDWVIFEDLSDRVRLIQKVSGTVSGVNWQR